MAPTTGGYINLSVVNRGNITEAAIIAFVNLKETAQATAAWALSPTEIIGISIGGFALIVIICAYFFNKKRKVLTGA